MLQRSPYESPNRRCVLTHDGAAAGENKGKHSDKFSPIFFSRVFFMAHPMSSIRLDTVEALSVVIGCHDLSIGTRTTSLWNRHINVTDSPAARFSTALFMAFTRTLTKRGRLSVCGDRTKYGQPAVVMTAIRRNLRGLPSRFEHQSRTASVSVL